VFQGEGHVGTRTAHSQLLYGLEDLGLHELPGGFALEGQHAQLLLGLAVEGPLLEYQGLAVELRQRRAALVVALGVVHVEGGEAGQDARLVLTGQAGFALLASQLRRLAAFRFRNLASHVQEADGRVSHDFLVLFQLVVGVVVVLKAGSLDHLFMVV